MPYDYESSLGRETCDCGECPDPSPLTPKVATRLPSRGFSQECPACEAGCGPLCDLCAAEVEADMRGIDIERARRVLAIN